MCKVTNTKFKLNFNGLHKLSCRGFLSAQDTAWMIRSWSMVNSNPLQVLEERENIYSLLSQTTDDSLKTNFTKFTIDPRTRYKNIPTSSKDEKIISLYDTDNKEEMRYLEEKFKSKSYFDSMAYQNIMRRYKALKAPFTRQVSFAGLLGCSEFWGRNPRGQKKLFCKD